MLDFFRSRYVALMEKSNIISKKWQRKFKRKNRASENMENMKIIHNFPPWNILLKNQDHKWLKVWHKIDKKTNKLIQKHSKEFDKRKFYRENGEAK